MWLHHAEHRPVAYDGLHRRNARRAALLHTNGGGTGPGGSLFGLWSDNAAGRNGPENRHIGAQLQVTLRGHAEQYVDTALVVYHAYSASEWAVGIETEDDGHPEHPWTDPQLETIVALLRELGVPPVLLSSPEPADGLGWHEQFPAWNRQTHRCPGHVREQQIRTEILPALQPPHHHPPAPAPAPTTEAVEVYLIHVPGDDKIFATDFQGTRWHVPNPTVLRDIEKATGRPVVEVTAATRDALRLV